VSLFVTKKMLFCYRHGNIFVTFSVSLIASTTHTIEKGKTYACIIEEGFAEGHHGRAKGEKKNENLLQPFGDFHLSRADAFSALFLRCNYSP
jgi:hypothetical protein